jgi:hypothetical protein
MADKHIDPLETSCLKSCIRGLHSTHTRVFTRLQMLEARHDKLDKEEIERLEREVQEEALNIK